MCMGFTVKISVGNRKYIYKRKEESTFKKFLEQVNKYIAQFRQNIPTVEVVIKSNTTKMDESSSSGSWNDDIDRLKREALKSDLKERSTTTTASEQSPDMGVFINRLASFQSWPDDALMSAVPLSHGGFYYTGKNDEVKCHECGVVIGNWRPNDVPLQRHYDASPTCKIVTSQIKTGANNIFPTGASNINIDENSMISQQKTRGQLGASNFNIDENSVTLEQNETLRTKPNTCKKKPVLIDNDTINTRNGTGVTHHIQNGIDSSRPVAIKSTTDALNVISDTPSTQPNNWFTPRDTTVQPTTSQQVDYTIETNRLASYVGNWPSDAYLKPPELASAGLYFTGPGDRVQCAWCRGGLYNWEQGDTAIGEHIRHFPECPFIKNRMAEMVRTPVTTTTVTTQREQATGNEERKENNKGTTYQPIVKIVQDMGYSKELVQKALDKLVSTNGVKITVDKLLDVVFDLENDDENNDSSSSSTSLEGAVGNIDLGDEVSNQEEMILPSDNHNSDMQTYQQLENTNIDSSESHLTVLDQAKPTTRNQELNALSEENTRLKGKTVCKVCMDKEVNMLFLPCRHLVCCEECGEALRHCPVCRTLIVGTVKTFLS